VEIHQLQSVIARTYGAQDRARGVDATFGWFIEEVGELSRAIRRQGREEQVLEFTDVLAWLVSLAELCDVDLDTEVSRRYGTGCPKCQASPCACGTLDPARP